MSATCIPIASAQRRFTRLDKEGLSIVFRGYDAKTETAFTFLTEEEAWAAFRAGVVAERELDALFRRAAQ